MNDTTHYHAGHNMPGYLPESDVEIFESFDAAKAYMIETLDRHGDNLFEIGQVDYADDLTSEMQDLNLDSGPQWGVIAAETSYWITQCDDPFCGAMDSLPGADRPTPEQGY